MKRLLSLIAVAAATLVAAPRAEAGHRTHASIYVTARTSCGCPVYAQTYVAYYDHWDRPVYRTRRLPVRHQCHRHRVRYRQVPEPCYTPGYHAGPVIVPRPPVPPPFARR